MQPRAHHSEVSLPDSSRVHHCPDEPHPAETDGPSPAAETHEDARAVLGPCGPKRARPGPSTRPAIVPQSDRAPASGRRIPAAAHRSVMEAEASMTG